MIIATASISGSAMTRMPMMVAVNHAHSKAMPQCWKRADISSAPPSTRTHPKHHRYDYHHRYHRQAAQLRLARQSIEQKLRRVADYVQDKLQEGRHASLRCLREFLAVEYFGRAALHR